MHKFIKIILIIFLLSFCVLLIWYFNIKIILADFYFRKAFLSRGKENNWPETLKYFQKTLEIEPNESFYRQRFSTDLMWAVSDFYKTKESKIEILNLAIKNIDLIPEKERRFEAKINQAKMYSEKANLTQKKEDFQKAETAFQKLAKISPKMAKIYNNWCQLKIYEKKWAEAKEMCQKAWNLYPSIYNEEMNKQHRIAVISEMSEVYEKLGEIYKNLDNYKKAEEMYKQVLKFFPKQKSYLYKKIADLYFLKGDLDKAIEYNQHGFALNRNDSVWPFSIALLYQIKGDLKMAKFYAEKALEINPDDKEIKEFLEKIKF